MKRKIHNGYLKIHGLILVEIADLISKDQIQIKTKKFVIKNDLNKKLFIKLIFYNDSQSGIRLILEDEEDHSYDDFYNISLQNKNLLTNINDSLTEIFSTINHILNKEEIRQEEKLDFYI